MTFDVDFVNVSTISSRTLCVLFSPSSSILTKKYRPEADVPGFVHDMIFRPLVQSPRLTDAVHAHITDNTFSLPNLFLVSE